jgi:uncharacterized protein
LNDLIVADAGPLIALALADSIGILALLHREVLVPEMVEAECLLRRDKPGVREIERAFKDGLLTRPSRMHKFSGIPIETLGVGESAAIELAESLGALLLIDERRGRLIATERGLRIVGTLAELVTARRRGLIPALRPLLDAISEGGYFLSEALVRQALESVGEDMD